METLKKLLGILFFLIVFSEPFPAHAASQKEWTVAVFFNGDNDLDEFIQGDLNELSKVGSKNWLNIVALEDHLHGTATISSIGPNGEIQRVADRGEIDMGDYRQLVQFMEFVISHFPAKKFGLVIWNHGSGWKDGKNPKYKGISYDQTSGNEISNGDLQIAMGEIKKLIGHNLDILCMDACLMQMAEVAFVCGDSCDFIVASEEEAPGMGVPYDRVFSSLQKNSSTEEFVKSWVKTYVDSYSGGCQGTKACTQSAIKCSALPALFDAIDGFAKASMASGFNRHFAEALKNVQRFMGQQNIDLVHFVNLVKEADNDSAIQNACEKVLKGFKGAVIASGKNGDSVAQAFGLAIYFPWDFHFDAAYDKIPFCHASLWDDMIHEYYLKEAARTIVHSLENHDAGPLEKYSRDIQAGGTPNQYVVPLVNFRVYCEPGMPSEEMEHVRELLRSGRI